MARLTLLCHGATADTRSARFPTGDAPLEQAALDRLQRRPPRLPGHDEALTSPALAARQTAELLRLAARVDPALSDLDAGSWAGRPLDELQRTAPEGLALWLGDPAAVPHGGESLAALLGRVGMWMDAVAGRGRLVAVVAPAVARAALVHALRAPPTAFWRIDVAPLAVVTLSGAAGRWSLKGLVPP